MSGEASAREPKTSWDQTAVFWLLLIAAMARFWDIGAKPLHHDESIHALGAWKIWTGEGYAYDPTYHGPFMYYLTAVMFFLLGDSDSTVRFGAALSGVLLCAAPLLIRRSLGRWGTVLAVALFAFSPVSWYMSRFFREDIYAALFNVAAACFAIRWAGERRGQDLTMALVAFTLTYCTKEISYITGFIFVTYVVLSALWDAASGRKTTIRALEAVAAEKRSLAWGLGLSAVVFSLFYSSFGSHMAGLWDGLTKALSYWLGQHDVARGGQPWFYYLGVLPANEPLLVVVGLAASAGALFRRGDRLRLFLIYWFWAALVIYSWAGEKMPWLTLHLVEPLVLLAALTLGPVFERLGFPERRGSMKPGPRGAALAWMGTAAVLVLFLLDIRIGTHLCYESPGDPHEIMVYTQSHRDVIEASQFIREAVYRETGDPDGEMGVDERMAQGKNTMVVIEDDCSWPLTWYLRTMSSRVRAHPASLDQWRAPIIVTPVQEDLGRVPILEAEGYKTILGVKDSRNEARTVLRMRWWWIPTRLPLRLTSLKPLFNYLVWREVWNKDDIGSYDMRLWISKDLQEKLKSYPLSYWPGKRYR